VCVPQALRASSDVAIAPRSPWIARTVRAGLALGAETARGIADETGRLAGIVSIMAYIEACLRDRGATLARTAVGVRKARDTDMQAEIAAERWRGAVRVNEACDAEAARYVAVEPRKGTG
jgi:hypothetical protein